MPLAIDTRFLEELEGNFSYGVVPENPDGSPLGHSGVTIGMGIDLGQQTEKTLREAGASPETVRKLKPYLGKTKEKAQALLAVRPLDLDPSVVSRLNDGIINKGVESVMKKFNEGSSVKFEDLPPEKQTIIYSINHQYGENGAPKFMKAAMAQDWEGVSHELNNFGDPNNVSRLARTHEYAFPPVQIKADKQKVVY